MKANPILPDDIHNEKNLRIIEDRGAPEVARDWCHHVEMTMDTLKETAYDGEQRYTHQERWTSAVRSHCVEPFAVAIGGKGSSDDAGKLSSLPVGKILWKRKRAGSCCRMKEVGIGRGSTRYWYPCFG